MKELHKPVLLAEVLAWLKPREGESYFDMTAGYGGHAREVLKLTRNYKDAVLNDRDERAVSVLREKDWILKQVQDDSYKPEIMHGDFYSTASSLVECNRTFDLILGDFGVSSPQLDEKLRGFSYIFDAPLDMRMDVRQKLSARTIVNEWSEREIAEILEKYGELSGGLARGVARAITSARPVETTGRLAEVVRDRMGRAWTHPEARVFQAVRIAVNGELEQIEKVLPLIPKLLRPGGRVALISFHSLEDRLVKGFLAEAASYGEDSELRILTKKPVVAGNVEVENNPRARSAKLRVAEKLQ